MMRTSIKTAKIDVSTTPPKKPPNTPPTVLTPLAILQASFFDVVDTIYLLNILKNITYNALFNVLPVIKSTMNTFKLYTSIIVYFVRHDNC